VQAVVEQGRVVAGQGLLEGVGQGGPVSAATRRTAWVNTAMRSFA
jgi:hypothetical protein